MTDQPAVRSYDPIWDELRAGGKNITRYPYDNVVSFVYRHRPDKPRAETSILEVGCGAGNNLWFVAREGFRALGVDACGPAIEFARSRFAAEGLDGDLRVGDFASLPFGDESIDLAIDRGALTCTGFSVARSAIDEVRRVLRPGGRFLFNPYSDRHTSRLSGRPGPDGLTVDISAGTVAGTGQVCFYGRRDVDEMFGGGWLVESVEHLELVEQRTQDISVHAEWRVIAARR